VTAANSNALYGSYIPNRIGILYALSKSGKGPIQNWIESETNKPYWFHLNENIYEDIYLDSLNENYIINVGGEFIGPDKIDHFFDQGYSYWVKSLYGVDDQQAVDFGMSSENGWYGLLSGGVFSFADLKANWEGYQFYKNLFSGDKPYLKLSEEGLISISSPFNAGDVPVTTDLDGRRNVKGRSLMEEAGRTRPPCNILIPML
jgi:hypothetical protein